MPHLRAQGRGHIVNITSIAGRAPIAGSGACAATKSALEGLSQTLSQEVASLGLKVTAVAPGGFRTEFLSEHSVRRSAPVSDAFASTAGQVVAYLDKAAGKQAGDPARAGTGDPGRRGCGGTAAHLLLGSDALRRAQEKLDAVIGEMNQWEATTRSTDFAETA